MSDDSIPLRGISSGLHRYAGEPCSMKLRLLFTNHSLLTRLAPDHPSNQTKHESTGRRSGKCKYEPSETPHSCSYLVEKRHGTWIMGPEKCGGGRGTCTWLEENGLKLKVVSRLASRNALKDDTINHHKGKRQGSQRQQTRRVTSDDNNNLNSIQTGAEAQTADDAKTFGSICNDLVCWAGKQTQRISVPMNELLEQLFNLNGRRNRLPIDNLLDSRRAVDWKCTTLLVGGGGGVANGSSSRSCGTAANTIATDISTSVSGRNKRQSNGANCWQSEQHYERTLARKLNASSMRNHHHQDDDYYNYLLCIISHHRDTNLSCHSNKDRCCRCCLRHRHGVDSGGSDDDTDTDNHHSIINKAPSLSLSSSKGHSDDGYKNEQLDGDKRFVVRNSGSCAISGCNWCQLSSEYCDWLVSSLLLQRSSNQRDVLMAKVRNKLLEVQGKTHHRAPLDRDSSSALRQSRLLDKDCQARENASGETINHEQSQKSDHDIGASNSSTINDKTGQLRDQVIEIDHDVSAADPINDENPVKRGKKNLPFDEGTQDDGLDKINKLINRKGDTFDLDQSDTLAPPPRQATTIADAQLFCAPPSTGSFHCNYGGEILYIIMEKHEPVSETFATSTTTVGENSTGNQTIEEAELSPRSLSPSSSAFVSSSSSLESLSPPESWRERSSASEERTRTVATTTTTASMIASRDVINLSSIDLAGAGATGSLALDGSKVQESAKFGASLQSDTEGHNQRRGRDLALEISLSGGKKSAPEADSLKRDADDYNGTIVLGTSEDDKNHIVKSGGSQVRSVAKNGSVEHARIAGLDNPATVAESHAPLGSESSDRRLNGNISGGARNGAILAPTSGALASQLNGDVSRSRRQRRGKLCRQAGEITNNCDDNRTQRLRDRSSSSSWLVNASGEHEPNRNMMPGHYSNTSANIRSRRQRWRDKASDEFCLASIVIDALNRIAVFKPDLNQLISLDDQLPAKAFGSLDLGGGVGSPVEKLDQPKASSGVSLERNENQLALCADGFPRQSAAADANQLEMAEMRAQVSLPLLYCLELVAQRKSASSEKPESVKRGAVKPNDDGSSGGGETKPLIVDHNQAELDLELIRSHCRQATLLPAASNITDWRSIESSPASAKSDALGFLTPTNGSVLFKLQLDVHFASNFSKDCGNLYVKYKLLASATNKASKWRLRRLKPLARVPVPEALVVAQGRRLLPKDSLSSSSRFDTSLRPEARQKQERLSNNEWLNGRTSLHDPSTSPAHAVAASIRIDSAARISSNISRGLPPSSARDGKLEHMTHLGEKSASADLPPSQRFELESEYEADDDNSKKFDSNARKSLRRQTPATGDWSRRTRKEAVSDLSRQSRHTGDGSRDVVDATNIRDTTQSEILAEGSTVTSWPDKWGRYHFSCLEQIMLELYRTDTTNDADKWSPDSVPMNATTPLSVGREPSHKASSQAVKSDRADRGESVAADVLADSRSFGGSGSDLKLSTDYGNDSGPSIANLSEVKSPDSTAVTFRTTNQQQVGAKDNSDLTQQQQLRPMLAGKDGDLVENKETDHFLAAESSSKDAFASQIMPKNVNPKQGDVTDQNSHFERIRSGDRLDKDENNNTKLNNKNNQVQQLADGVVILEEECQVVVLFEFYSSDFYGDKLQGWAHLNVPISKNQGSGAATRKDIRDCDRNDSPQTPPTYDGGGHKLITCQNDYERGCSSTDSRAKRQLTEVTVIRPHLSTTLDKLRYYLISQLPETTPTLESVSILLETLTKWAGNLSPRLDRREEHCSQLGGGFFFDYLAVRRFVLISGSKHSRR